MQQHNPPPIFSDRVEQALDICSNIEACNAYLSRGDDTYARAAALMLPCYRASLVKLVSHMTTTEETALVSRLQSAAGTNRNASSHGNEVGDTRIAVGSVGRL